MATILIVEERATDRKFLATLLRAHGHTVHEAADGAEALTELERLTPALVISDLLMPTLDGFEFVRRMRDKPHLGRTPVMFYTATYQEREALELARQIGAADVLTKPSESSVILSRVDTLLNAVADEGNLWPDPVALARDHVKLIASTLATTATDLERSNQRLNVLVSVAHEIAAERNPRSLLVRMCHAARDITVAQYAVFGVIADDSLVAPTMIVSGLDEDRIRGMSTPRVQTPLLANVLERRLVVRQRNEGGDPTVLGLPADHPPVHSVLVVPIATATRVYGWLAAANKIGAEWFERSDEELALTLATHAAVAYENALLYEKARADAAALELEAAEHRRTERRLRDTQERIEFALSSAGIGVWDCDVVRDRVTWSRSMWSVLGRDPETSAPKTMAEFYGLIHADDFDRVRTAARQAIAARRDLQLEYRVTGTDGLIRTIDTRGRVVYGSDGTPIAIYGVNLDISHRRSLEEQLRQAQKMEALGQLAGGIAHDFNNMLTAILGYAQFIAEAPELPADLRGDLDLIVESGRRASALTKQLLAFSRKQVLQPIPLDLNDLVRRTSPILQRLIGEHITLTLRLDDRLAPAVADPHQVEQILLNLSVNARDAMPQGGDLIIETANAALDELYASSHANVKPGAYAMLAVSDTGMGMNADTRARLFDPFFTTKPAGVGTGLGLSTVYGIVQQSGGSIWVYSEPGQGATFKVYLPLGAGEETTADLPDQPQPPPPGGRESILVVEDERAVRLLMGATLKRVGYTVFDADTPSAAEQVFLAHRDEIALLITDVVMPGMNGPSLYARLRARAPALKVIYASGYTDGSIGYNGRLESDVAFLQKPFSGDALMRKVREVLDS